MQDILNKFIQERMDSYTEPQRKGTPKGQSIGLSKTKYYASLLMLTGVRLKDIAQELNISYGTLRNWNAGEQFRSIVTEHCAAFTDYLINHVNSGQQVISGRRGYPLTHDEVRDLIHKALISKATRKTKDNEFVRDRSDFMIEEIAKEFLDESLRILNNPKLGQNDRKQLIVMLSLIRGVI